MKELDDIIKYLQYNLLVQGFLKDEIRTAAYAEAIKNINKEYQTNYDVSGLLSLKFESRILLNEYCKKLPIIS